MNLWEQALDHQIEIRNFWLTEKARRYARGYVADQAIKDRSGRVTNSDQLWRAQQEVLTLGDTYTLTQEMQTMAEVASRSFRGEVLNESDLMSPAGFCYLPRPIHTRDIWGKDTAYRAFSWGKTILVDNNTGKRSPGIMLSVYSLASDPDDYSSDVPTYMAFTGQQWSLMHYMPWDFGRSYEDVTTESTRKIIEDGDAVVLFQFVQAVFRLMQQTITTKTHVQPNRATRRRAERDGFDKRYIVVVNLRRPKSTGSGEPQGVEWSHQWLVSGHWRNQYFASLDIHRQIWISPYIKGPEDKPLEVREGRVFQLVR